VDITTDEIYKTATEIQCPVCGKAFSELKYAVPWISLGDQKIFTCSEEHAHEVFNNPVRLSLSLSLILRLLLFLLTSATVYTVDQVCRRG
jgi:hypothetical protein